MKLITVNGQDFIIEFGRGNWHCRIGDCLIIMRTIKEIKKSILEELTNSTNGKK